MGQPQEWSEIPGAPASSRSGLTPQILQCSQAMKSGCRECPGSGLSSSPLGGTRGGPSVPGSQDLPGSWCPWVVWTHLKLFPAHKTLLKLFQWLQVSWLSPRCQSGLLVFRCPLWAHRDQRALGSSREPPEAVKQSRSMLWNRSFPVPASDGKGVRKFLWDPNFPCQGFMEPQAHLVL